MERKRERKAKESDEKGIPVADAGQEVIWNDPILKSPFISNPFISRLKGKAELNQALAYNLYFNDLTQKWKPLSDITISTVKTLARYYPGDAPTETILGDYPIALTSNHLLMVNDGSSHNRLSSIQDKLDTLIAKGKLLGSVDYDLVITIPSEVHEYTYTGRMIKNVGIMIETLGAINNLKVSQGLSSTSYEQAWALGGVPVIDTLYSINVLPCTHIKVEMLGGNAISSVYTIACFSESGIINGVVA